jgi:hypothetical protein
MDINGRRHKLLTALSHAHARHGGDLGAVLTEIEHSIHDLSNEERADLFQRLIERLANEMESAEDA